MNNELFIYFLISFVISIILFIIWIPIFRKLKIGQTIRIDGPEEHLKKNGTPTMGGLIMLLSFTCSFIICALVNLKLDYKSLLFYLFPIICYGLIGFIDDILIIIRHNNEGVKPLTKIIMQVFCVLIYYLLFHNYFNKTVDLFFVKIDFNNFYFLFILLIFVSTTNAVNLTDGLDGLATGLLIISFLGVLVLGILKENKIVCYYSICIIASLLAFLLFNHYPAKIFMGNVGSLMLGASLATLMIALNEEMLLLIIAFVFIVETLSVIIQVSYFKITKGKRILKMAPLHHHFEKSGYSEWQIDFIFWTVALVSIMMLLIVIMG